VARGGIRKKIPESDDEEDLFADSDSSSEPCDMSVGSIETPPQARDDYRYLIDDIYHEDERFYLLHPRITAAGIPDDYTTNSQKLDRNLLDYWLFLTFLGSYCIPEL
jgi:hypothetical protein